MNFLLPASGIGLAASFAGAWRLKNEHEQIGLIPCADGGSSLDDWEVGGALFENALFQAKAAQSASTLKGILWHQGENDSFAGRYAEYYNKLDAIVDAFRPELNVPEVPFIAGALGNFLSSGRYGNYFTEYKEVNQAIQKFTETRPNCYFVTATGLTANEDGLHFNAVSQRKLGIRYFEAFFKKKSIMLPPDNENELVNIIQDRALTPAEKIALLEICFAGGKISLDNLEQEIAIININ